MVALRRLGGMALTSVSLALACGGESFTEGEAGGTGGQGGSANGGSSGKSTGGTGATGGSSGGSGAVGGTGNVGGTGMGATGGTGNVGAVGGTGNVGATGGTGNVGGTGMGALGGTGSGARGGTGGTGGGVAGGSCTDPDVTPEDQSGYWTKGTTIATDGELTDTCDADGNLVEHFCETNCSIAKAAPLPPADGGSSGIVAPCYFLGTVGTTVATCPELCLDGACVAVRR